MATHTTLVLLAASLAGCSESSGGGASSTGDDGGSVTTTDSGSSASSTSGTPSTTGSSTTTGASGGSGGAGGGGGSGGSGGSTGGGGSGEGGSGYTEEGVCGVRSEGTVTTESFDAFEEFFLLGDSGLGDDLCVVRFQVTGVGEAPPGCDENAGQQQECLWTHLVEYSSPEVVTNVDGACENSALHMDEDSIAAIDGSRVAYGYVFEYQGHNSVLMVYDEVAESWGPGVSAGWSEESGDFLFDRRDGFCGY